MTGAPQCNRIKGTGQDTNKKIKIYKYTNRQYAKWQKTQYTIQTIMCEVQCANVILQSAGGRCLVICLSMSFKSFHTEAESLEDNLLYRLRLIQALQKSILRQNINDML